MTERSDEQAPVCARSYCGESAYCAEAGECLAEPVNVSTQPGEGVGDG